MKKLQLSAYPALLALALQGILIVLEPQSKVVPFINLAIVALLALIIQAQAKEIERVNKALRWFADHVQEVPEAIPPNVPDDLEEDL